MRKLGLDGLAYRVTTMEPLFYDFFHHRNIPNIPEQTIHLHNIVQSKPNQCQSSFHVIKRTMNLLFNGAANVANAVTEETEIACFDYSGMCPGFVNIISFDHVVILLLLCTVLL